MSAETIKAITIRQIWAQCVATGIKSWETRSWYTQYRGKLLIHSAQKKVDKKIAIAFQKAMGNESEMVPHLVDIFEQAFNDSFPRGYIVAVADLTNCFLMVDSYEQYAWKLSGKIDSSLLCSSKDDLLKKSGFDTGQVDDPKGFLAVPVGIDKKGTLREAIAITDQTEQERILGNWIPGNYAWQLKNVLQQKPIKCKGQLGLWNPSEEILNEVIQCK